MRPQKNPHAQFSLAFLRRRSGSRSRDGYGTRELQIARDMDGLLSRSRERLRAHEYPVFEDGACEAGCLLDERRVWSGLCDGFDDPLAPETGADVVLQLEVRVQAGNDGVWRKLARFLSLITMGTYRGR